MCGRGLCGVILFVVGVGVGGRIERPMAWCTSLFPKKLKIEKSKIQNLKKKKIKRYLCHVSLEIFDLRRYFCYVGTSVHFAHKSVLEGLKSGLELKFVIILYFRVYVYMRLRAFLLYARLFL